VTAATLFVNPIYLSPTNQLWLMLPLLVTVAVIHKTMRTGDIRRLLRDVLALVAYMAAGTVVLAVVLWLVMTYWPRG